MSSDRGYQAGEWNFVCDQCGLRYKSSEARLRWDNAMVCNTPGCWEERQPQDFVRNVVDDISTPWARNWSPVFQGAPVPDTALGEIDIGGNPAIGGP